MAKPILTLRSGTCVVAVFANKVEHKGKSFDSYKITFQKRYRKDEEWKSSYYFELNDIPRIKLLASEVFKSLALHANSPQKEEFEYKEPGK